MSLRWLWLLLLGACAVETTTVTQVADVADCTARSPFGHSLEERSQLCATAVLLGPAPEPGPWTSQVLLDEPPNRVDLESRVIPASLGQNDDLTELHFTVRRHGQVVCTVATEAEWFNVAALVSGPPGRRQAGLGGRFCAVP